MQSAALRSSEQCFRVHEKHCRKIRCSEPWSRYLAYRWTPRRLRRVWRKKINREYRFYPFKPSHTEIANFENPYNHKTWRVQGSRSTASRVDANKRMKRWDIITHYLYPKQQYSKGNNEQARAKQICIIVPVESRLIIKYIKIRHMSGKWQYTDDISETNLYDNRISKNISRITFFHNRFDIFNRL